MNDAQVCDYRNKRIGYIFQTFNLIQQFNVRDNVAVPLLLSGMKRKNHTKRFKNSLKRLA